MIDQEEHEDISRRVVSIVIERLELEGFSVDSFPRDAVLFGPEQPGSLNLDSIASLEIISGLADEFELDFDDVDREHFTSINTLARYIAAEVRG